MMQTLSARMKRNLSEQRGACTASFQKFDFKWEPYDVMDCYESSLFDNHRDYEPSKDCGQSASAGVHAFLIVQLEQALKAAPADTAVADIGCGTGFLLAVFASFVQAGVDVVGIEFDHEAVAHANRVLGNSTAGVEVFEQYAHTYADKLHEDELAGTRRKRFSVMNVGFASEAIPSYLKNLLADSATAIMPICSQPLVLRDIPGSQGGKACKSKFHLFENKDGALTESAVGPDMHFFYVALAE